MGCSNSDAGKVAAFKQTVKGFLVGEHGRLNRHQADGQMRRKILAPKMSCSPPDFVKVHISSFLLQQKEMHITNVRPKSRQNLECIFKKI